MIRPSNCTTSVDLDLENPSAIDIFIKLINTVEKLTFRGMLIFSRDTNSLILLCRSSQCSSSVANLRDIFTEV